MRINKLSYENKDIGWKLDPISFGDLTLLVGASGVGKTRILNSILALRKIAQGASYPGAAWHVEFTTSDGVDYIWEGKFENQGKSSEKYFPSMVEIIENDLPDITYEKVFKNDTILGERKDKDIFLKEKKTIRLSPKKSVLFLLREEDSLRNIHFDFYKILFEDFLDRHILLSQSAAFAEMMKDGASRFSSIENMPYNLKNIRAIPSDIKAKLYVLSVHEKSNFDNLSSIFMEIFPTVEDVKIDIMKDKEVTLNYLHQRGDFLLIQIKEKGVEQWIDETRMSSGMLRTFLQIAEIYLCPDNSVILIDEFENSLGINCIDELTNSILVSDRNIQFILTSHHPYIIDHIPHEYWKIVGRKGSTVVAHDASEFDFDKSKHKAFTQLTNLDLFLEGTEG